MTLRRLDITAVRNLARVKLAALGKTNIFHGDNGSGKTSLLESVYLLGTARSFRSGKIRSVITHGDEECTVYGEIAGEGDAAIAIGVSRRRDGTLEARLAGEPVRAAAELAEQLPLQLINAESFGLLLGAPSERRQFLDWGLFHVARHFYAGWQQFQRALKQRNNLLRRARAPRAELAVWTREFCAAAEHVDRQRREYFDALAPRFAGNLRRLAPELEAVSLRYRRGWDKQQSLAESLAAMEATDREQGFTQAGPQRADLRVLTDGQSAAEVLSRGQQKLVICALKLAQGQLLEEGKRRACVYLVDDLPAELDRRHCRLVAEVLSELGSQVFITCVEPGELAGMWPRGGEAPGMFHVEHGAVRG